MGPMKTCVLVLSIFITCCEAYKVLVVFPVPSKSHKYLGDGYVRNLLNDGHEVTYITPYKYNSPHPSLRVIQVKDNIGLLHDEIFNLKNYIESTMTISIILKTINDMQQIPSKTLENVDVLKMLSDPKEHFDVVIVEWMLSEIFSGLAEIFDAPLIWSTSTEVTWQGLELLNQPTNPAYFTSVMSGNMPPFSLVQRTGELVAKALFKLANLLYFDVLQSKSYDQLIAPILIKRGKKSLSFYEVQTKGSLILGNTHTSLGQTTTLPPNYVNIGGYHIDDNVKPLPENLQKIMDNSKHGVIYFSMGSILKSTDISDEMKSELLDIFSKLKQTVFWKLEKPLPNLPKNVHILEWAPQQSILSHPNCVLFITHGGLLSTTESIHFGVPTIGIPVYGDQYLNVYRMVHKGYGKKVDLTTSLAADLKVAIDDILSDKRYAEKAKELSMIYHDRPVKPGVELTHWVKHVVRSRGALYLKPAEQITPVYQQLYLDLIALVASIVLLLKYVIRRLLRKKVEAKNKYE